MKSAIENAKVWLFVDLARRLPNDDNSYQKKSGDKWEGLQFLCQFLNQFLIAGIPKCIATYFYTAILRL